MKCDTVAPFASGNSQAIPEVDAKGVRPIIS